MDATTEGGVATAGGSGRAIGMPWITPYLMVKDGAAALAFYEAAFGFRAEDVRHSPDGKVFHAKAVWKDEMIMLGPEGGCDGTALSPATRGIASPVMLYVYCDDVDALFDRAVAAGATGTFPPYDAFWGDRVCMLVDPDGHTWNFATNKGEMVDGSAGCA